MGGWVGMWGKANDGASPRLAIAWRRTVLLQCVPDTWEAFSFRFGLVFFVSGMGYPTHERRLLLTSLSRKLSQRYNHRLLPDEEEH